MQPANNDAAKRQDANCIFNLLEVSMDDSTNSGVQDNIPKYLHSDNKS